MQPTTRACRTCGQSKLLMDFYVYTQGSIDRDCKPCRCAKVRANRLVKVEQYTEYERGRANLPHRVEARKEYAQTPHGRANGSRAKRAYIERNPAKRAAHNAVWSALQTGRLVRQPCEACGAIAQAHHDDYGKPLEVRWLCTTHHAEWHKHNTPACPDQEASAA